MKVKEITRSIILSNDDPNDDPNVLFPSDLSKTGTYKLGGPHMFVNIGVAARQVLRPDGLQEFSFD